jgi:hypothetical protein
MAKQDRLETVVRLPREMQVWLERQAVRNGVSRNAEITRSIRVVMDLEKKARSQRTAEQA